VGAALGLSVMTGLMTAHTRYLTATGIDLRTALTGGYHQVGIVCMAILSAATFGAVFIRSERRQVTSPLPKDRNVPAAEVAKAGFGTD
jgi:hypothetical protein